MEQKSNGVLKLPQNIFYNCENCEQNQNLHSMVFHEGNGINYMTKPFFSVLQGKSKEGSPLPEYGGWHKAAKVDRYCI
jgi:hypothetical protein